MNLLYLFYLLLSLERNMYDEKIGMDWEFGNAYGVESLCGTCGRAP